MKILYADKYNFRLRPVAERLRKAHHEVSEANTLIDARKMLAAGKFDLVIVSATFKIGNDGLSFAQQANRPGVKVILLTHEPMHSAGDYIRIVEATTNLDHLVIQLLAE